MRTTIAFIFMVLMAALVGCAVVASRVEKPIAVPVRRLLLALLPPVFGNFLIILSGEPMLATIGCYTYYIGMDVMMMALFYFTSDYCNLGLSKSKLSAVCCALMFVDVVQLVMNARFHQAFTLEPIMVEGYPYYSLVPHLGQGLHRVCCYGIFLLSLGYFGYKTFSSPKIYVERYAVIFLAMLVGGLVETFYVFSGTPMDISMVFFGFFGLAVFYFSLYYRPVRLLDRMLGLVVSNMHDAVIFYDIDGNCIYANDVANTQFKIASEADYSRYEDALAKITEGDADFRPSRDWTKQEDRDLGWGIRSWRFVYVPACDETGKRMGASLTMYDRTNVEVKLRHETYLATHDNLTGLYNQKKLYERVERLIRENPETEYCVVGIDVRDFKMINDVFSRAVGDRVLNVIATRLRKHASTHEVYGRLSGDKFGYVLPASEFNEAEIEERLADHDFMGSGMQYPIVIHMGVYKVTDSTVAVSVMFDRAFLALDSIKNEYQRHIAYYDDSMRDEILWSQKLAGELPQAIEDGQLRPYLHPMVNEVGEVIGAEVLARWIHPTEGFLPPGRFIPQLEKSGMVAQVDVHMWRRACQILRDWQDRGIDLFLSVNISPKDFYFIDVLEVIRGLVEEYEVDPHRLRLEITETVMMTEMEKRLQILDELRSMGFLVEMDDFGSGYSSLNMLKDMPVDLLKIDMMFLYKTKDTRKAQLILQNIINLSGDLGIPSLTEGVETRDQRDMLLSMGCKMFQGYYFAKPMPLADFEAFYGSAA